MATVGDLKKALAEIPDDFTFVVNDSWQWGLEVYVEQAIRQVTIFT